MHTSISKRLKRCMMVISGWIIPSHHVCTTWVNCECHKTVFNTSYNPRLLKRLSHIWDESRKTLQITIFQLHTADCMPTRHLHHLDLPHMVDCSYSVTGLQTPKHVQPAGTRWIYHSQGTTHQQGGFNTGVHKVNWCFTPSQPLQLYQGDTDRGVRL